MNTTPCQASHPTEEGMVALSPRLGRPRILRAGWTSGAGLLLAWVVWIAGGTGLAQSGTLDTAFVPAGVVVNGVQATVVTPVGQVLVGGWVSATNTSSQALQGLVRLNGDGTLDGSFGVPGTAAMVSALAIDTEDRIVAAGVQTNGLNAVVRRLQPDGSLDPSLDLVVNASISPWIYALAHQADGRLLVAGSFTRANGVPRTNLFRVHSDGTLDASFRTNFTSGGGILAMEVQTDGRLLIGGYFTNVQGVARRGIARLNTDGTLDTTFQPGTGVQGLVKAVRVEADGRILVGGHFFSVNGALRSGLVRLTPAGAVDATFNVGGAAGLGAGDSTGDGPSVDAIALQGDGRIVVAGNFTRFGHLTRQHVARLHWGGEVDEGFDPGVGPDAPVRSLAIDSMGRLMVAGDFSSVGGVSRPGVARLESDGTLPVLPSIVTSPVDQGVIIGRSVTFSVEAMGTPALGYQWLKSGLPIWGQTDRTLVIPSSQLSDGGRYSVAVANAAGEVISAAATLTVSPAPVAPSVVLQPVGAMAMPGDSVALTAAATGSKPMIWQWSVGNLPVANATNETLTFASVTPQSAGNYTAKVVNGGGSATTAAAALVVYQPPSDRTGWVGSNLTFRVDVSGPGPFGHQWWFQGEPVPGAFRSTLTLTNLQLAMAGQYWVVLSNAFRRATSPPATLVVNMPPRIAAQPSGTNALQGAAVELSVLASGSEPLSYQWRFQGTNLTGQTSATLSLGPLASTHAGHYSVVVSNVFGSVSSDAVTVTVQGSAVAHLALDSVDGYAGGDISVPLWLVGVGNENTVATSLTFDPAVLSLVSVSDAAAVELGASVIVNSSDAAKGRIGLLIAHPPGSTFSPGSNHLVTVHLKAVSGLSAATETQVGFGTGPVPPGLLSGSVRPLPFLLDPGTVTLQAGFEADLSPAPNGDRLLTPEDWSLVAQMVAGLIEPSDPSQFVRADCAPAETLGDGILAAADWTQAGRYVAGIDSPAPAGGPTPAASGAGLHGDAPVVEGDASPEPLDGTWAEVPRSSRRLATLPRVRRFEARGVRLTTTTVASVPIQLSAVGDENTAGFTLTFDPARARLRGIHRGSGLDQDSVLVLNTNQTARGRLGVLFARPVGVRFAPGTHQVLQVDLELLGSQPATLSFGDAVVRREVVSDRAEVLTAEYLPGQIQLDGPARPAVPRLPSRLRSGAVLMRWDAAQPGRYILEASSDLEHWTFLNEWNVLAPATLEFQDPNPGQWAQRYFRMR